MLLDKKEVLAFLPHRDPFLFIDSVESVELCDEFKALSQIEIEKKHLLGSIVTAHYRTKKEHPIFEGHFPGSPILPGVVQIEMMAQASIFMVAPIIKDLQNSDVKVALMNVSNAKFRNPVYPEMDLVIKTVCERIRGNIVSTECKLFHKDDLMAQVTTLASIQF